MYSEREYKFGPTGQIMSSHASEEEAIAAAKQLNDQAAAKKAATVLSNYEGTTSASKEAALSSFPGVFATPEWGVIAGWKRGDRPVFYIPIEIKMSKHAVGKYGTAEVFVLHEAELTESWENESVKVRFRKGLKTLAVSFSSLPLGDLIVGAYAVTNGRGQSLKIYDVSNIDVDLVKDIDIR